MKTTIQCSLGLIFAAVLAMSAGGCGSQSVLLGTRSDYLLTTQDALALPGEEVTLTARLEAGDLLQDQVGSVVLFTSRPSQGSTQPARAAIAQAAQTNSDGVALLSFRPPRRGDYPLVADVSPNGLATAGPAPQPLLVCCRTRDDAMIVVDLDRTLVAGEFREVLFSQGVPMADSVAVMSRLAERYTMVYMTHRPPSLGPKTRVFLQHHRYPVGPLLMPQGGKFLEGSRQFKTQTLASLRQRFDGMRYGIGDKTSDAQAYLDNGLTPILLVNPPDIRFAKQVQQLLEEIPALPEQVEVVLTWPQIEDIILRGGHGDRQAALGALRLRLAQLQRQAATQPTTTSPAATAPRATPRHRASGSQP